MKKTHLLEWRVKILVSDEKRKHEKKWNTRKDLPSRLAGCVRYAKIKKTVSAESGNITFMLTNKTFFFSRWTHDLFVPRKRAKWKVTSQWAFYDAMNAEHSGLFPVFFPRRCTVFLKPFCLFRQNMLHLKVMRSFSRKSRWKKHIAFFYFSLYNNAC